MRNKRWVVCLSAAPLLLAPAVQSEAAVRVRDHYTAPRGWILDQRYHHDRYYPPIETAVVRLPVNYRDAWFEGQHNWFSGGVWYRAAGPQFVVAMPPIGLAVSFLPDVYTTVWAGSVPYYYANHVYYQWRPVTHDYVVVAPTEASVTTVPTAAAPIGTDIFAYPKNGQSEEQQARDRYECYRWAISQSGYDPATPSSASTATRLQDPEQQHAAYRRADIVCLDARGYAAG
jgi:uncharacterized protein DUF6515